MAAWEDTFASPRRREIDVTPRPAGGHGPQQLADILERVLDKGIVVAGDIQVRLLDIELLTIKLRLVIASLDKAREMGIDWWEGDPFLSSKAQARRLTDGKGGAARRRKSRRPRALPAGGSTRGVRRSAQRRRPAKNRASR